MDPRLAYIVKHKRPQVNTQPRERRGDFWGEGCRTASYLPCLTRQAPNHPWE